MDKTVPPSNSHRYVERSHPWLKADRYICRVRVRSLGVGLGPYVDMSSRLLIHTWKEKRNDGYHSRLNRPTRQQGRDGAAGSKRACTNIRRFIGMSGSHDGWAPGHVSGGLVVPERKQRATIHDHPGRISDKVS